jgi:hypothetical protein
VSNTRGKCKKTLQSANLPLVATTLVELVSKFANGVVDTGGGANKFKMTLVLFSGAWGGDDL